MSQVVDRTLSANARRAIKRASRELSIGSVGNNCALLILNTRVRASARQLLDNIVRSDITCLQSRFVSVKLCFVKGEVFRGLVFRN